MEEGESGVAARVVSSSVVVSTVGVLVLKRCPQGRAAAHN